MLHVILIDDEPLIRNGLQKMFSWEDFHMEISAVSQTEVLHSNIFRRILSIL